jgi:PAS domain S-box-containing protein
MESKIRILHIDDNLHDRQLVEDALRKENGEFILTEADTREKFEKHLSEGTFDLILSDFNILGFDGLQVLHIVKQKDPDIPVIIVTGTGSEEIAIQAMNMGAADYVIKSVKHIQGLAPTIRKILAGKKARERYRQVEKALQESEMKFKTLTEASPVGIFSTDATGTTNYVNPRWCEISGINDKDAMGNGWLKSVHPDDRKTLLEEWERAALSHSASAADYRFMHDDGSIVWVSGQAVPQKDPNGTVIGYIGTITDITERKHAEIELIKAKNRAEENDRLKTAFLHNISHEIRTPMNAIVGFTSLLSEPDLDRESTKSYIEVITQSTNQLLSIVNDIIEISNIEAGLLKVTSGEVSLNKLIDKLYRENKSAATNKGLEFIPENGLPDKSAIVLTDRAKLIQVLSNLLSNAFKFTFTGQVSFGYTLKNDYIEFHVRDTGIGISEDEFTKIFERFYQVEHSAARQFEGTGLGLSISKAYVKLLGGEIRLNSEPGKGSTFYFTIPYRQVNDQKVEDSDVSAAKKPHSAGKKTILIAEDDNNNFYLIKQLLSGLDANIIHASNGVEAVKICSTETKIDLILMDIKMPVMDGYTATREILQQFPSMKILAQTAYADDEVKAKDAGCIGFISKPFNNQKFIKTVKENL